MKKNILLVIAVIGFNLQAVSFNEQSIECLKNYSQKHLFQVIKNLGTPCKDEIDNLRSLLLGTGINYNEAINLAFDLLSNDACFNAITNELEKSECDTNFINF